MGFRHAALGTVVGLLWGHLGVAIAGEIPADPAAGSIYRLKVASAVASRLAEEYDFFTYLPKDGEGHFFLTPEEVEALRAQGFTPELDTARTARLRELPQWTEREVELFGGTIPGFSCYRTVDQTYADLQALAAAHPDLVSLIDIGDTWEKQMNGQGDDILVAKITRLADTFPKSKLVIMAAMHARELATAEAATRFAEYLVAGYGVDPERTWLLDHREIHIIPQLNPDGRTRAEAGQLWRKNADNAFCANSSSRGVDLNRNASFLWSGTGASANACSETFRGPSAGSEPETQAIEAYLAQVFPDQRGGNLTDPAPADAEGIFFSLHSYGEMVLYPWEAITSAPPNQTALRTLGRRLGFFNQYTVCQTCFPSTAGTTVDEAYGEYGVAAYTFEVGNDFFEPCTNFENPIWPQNREAFLFAAKAARRPYQEPAGPAAINVALSAAQTATPVTVTARIDDTRYFSGGQGTEPTQAIAAAFFTVDTPPGPGVPATPLAPVDGSFNTSAENVTGTLDPAGLTPGRHLVYVYGQDTTGQNGVPTAIFLEVLDTGLLFADGFESGNTAAWD